MLEGALHGASTVQWVETDTRSLPEVIEMRWGTRRGLSLLGAALLVLIVLLVVAISTVSYLSAQDSLPLGGGIAVFALLTFGWLVVTSWFGLRWWQWQRAGRVRHDTRVLVVYGTRRGGTAGIAEAMGASFVELGWPVEVRPARSVSHPGGNAAVIVGGSLYMNRWHPDARRFVRRHATALRDRPVWLFASGPLGASPAPEDAPIVPQVAAAADHIDARGTVTFGGRLEEGATGPVARRILAQGRGGDFRDLERVRDWAKAIATDLREKGPARGAPMV